MKLSILHLLVCLVFHVGGQRPGFAGSRPIGYPELYDRPTTPKDELGNRFGEGNATTQRLPLEANGDRDLVDRLSKLPVDKQPFWFINWQALEDQRENPQTYPLRPNPFVEANTKTDESNKKLVKTDGQDKQGIPNTNLRIQNEDSLGSGSSEEKNGTTKATTEPVHFENRSENLTTDLMNKLGENPETTPGTGVTSKNDDKKPNTDTKNPKISNKVFALLFSG